jgi:hypothetical protein
MKSKTTLSNLYVSLSQNSSASNSTLGDQMINDAHRYLMQKYFFNESSYSIVTVAQQQGYYLPYNYSKLKTGTLTIGNLKWTPTEILTRRDWDQLNVFPYYSDIPNNFFIYNGQFNLWPIPSSNGNTISFNYKIRVPDLILDDYVAGTVTATNSSTTVTGAGTSWLTVFSPTAGSVLNQNLWIRLTEPSGDGNWYQISSIQTNTSLTLLQPYQGITVAGAAYTIGQMPLLLEDFQDLLVYRPLMIYYASINKDTEKYNQFKSLYDEGIKMMDDYVGSKAMDVNLGRNTINRNPNLFYQG